MITCQQLSEKLINNGKEYGLRIVFRNEDNYIGYSRFETIFNLLEDSDIIIIWHTSDYAYQMFSNSDQYSENRSQNVEIGVMEKVTGKIIIPVFLAPLSDIDPSGFDSPIAPDFIKDRIGIPITKSKSVTKENIINKVDEKIMPVVAEVFQKKHLRKL